MTDKIEPSRDIQGLIDIMAALRTPKTGCPWDLEQTFETIVPYTIEEAYEVADAIERRDLADLKDELGDLLLQVVYHARMAQEQAVFSFGDVVEAVTRKMIRRHPHVFGDETARSAGAVKGHWDKIKAEENAERALSLAPGTPPAGSLLADAGQSLLADVPVTLPALSRAIKLQEKAARAGFDWPGLVPVFDKVREELAEFEDVAIPLDPRITSTPSGRRNNSPAASGLLPAGESDAANKDAANRKAIKEEFGDLLFVLANVARHLEIDPEACLRGANQKFVRRFGHIETRLAGQGRSPAQSSLEEMDALWDEAKAIERGQMSPNLSPPG